MLTVEQALQTLLGVVRPIQDVEEVETLIGNGRVLASAMTSSMDVPPRDNAQMDGYAVRATDCQDGNVLLPISQRIPAGYTGVTLQQNTAARIFTGAFLPDGADAVVMQEQCSVEDSNGQTMVRIRHQPQTGEWIRRKGEDISMGATLLEAGTRLRPQELGLAASVGLAKLTVVRRLRVAIFFTGDELTMPGETLKPGAIYNSNRFLLTALLQNLGCEITDYGNVSDNLADTRKILREAAIRHDLILTSGGVSVGEEDYIRPAVAAEGNISMWQIAMKPGKPLAFGEIRRTDSNLDTAFFLGLPGNPVSSFVTFLLFVRPFLLRLQGVRDINPIRIRVRADFNWSKADKRNEFLRVRMNQNGGLDLFHNQGSGVLTSTVWGDGLVDVAPGCTIQAGDVIDYLPFHALMY
ncbi:molybdopterin molybdotransferase MoeA [Undibacterium sp. FT137W]|uniref:Molybdopterin molybdenumtransferase n=2 Tax=Undibacterium fentianense TaxID=2828728 RepID=A0A941DYY0_9BURK|nr:molybdopterin molybdotransferase MoeA [Undibacterium fentianense]